MDGCAPRDRPWRKDPSTGSAQESGSTKKERIGGIDMPAFPRACRLVLAILALFMLVGVLSPAGAQQPTTVNPTASSVKEDQLLEQMRIISGRGTIPDAKSYNLEQPAGREWREFHEVTLPRI